MSWDRVGTMKKIDMAGESAMAKIRGQRDAGKGVGVQDRWKLAKGKDERWDNFTKRKDSEDQQDQQASTSSHNRSRVPPAIASRRPPATATATATQAAPPPPPARTNSSANAGNGKSYIEFSKFNQQDKEAFFGVLDQFFNHKLSISSPSSTSKSNARPTPHPPSPPPSFNSIPPPIYTPPTQESAPTPPSRTNSTNNSSRGPPPPTAPRSNPSSTFHLLTASTTSPDDPCSALSAATFFVYPDSFPEWKSQWYTSKTDRQPPNLKDRKDILWKCSTSYTGTSNEMIGSVFFSDLSFLIYSVKWDSNRSETFEIVVEYKDIPATLDQESLKAASATYGNVIAEFAEDAENSGKPVGDGECWTLADQALKYVNDLLKSDGREDFLLETIGRTHGHLIFAGEGGSSKEEQVGRWRGGDRKRDDWGGVRRGDIVEWYKTTCSEVGARKGSWVSQPENALHLEPNIHAYSKVLQPSQTVNSGRSRTYCDYYF